MAIPSFKEYITSLGRLTAHIDPTAASPEAAEIRQAAAGLADLDEITAASLADWVRQDPTRVRVLGLAVGLSQERLKSVLKDKLDTAGWIKLGKEHPEKIIDMLDRDFDLIRLITVQRNRDYDFGDVLVARAGTRSIAKSAGGSGRKLEDEIEAIIEDLGLPFKARTRFYGRNGTTGPCDFAIPNPREAVVVIAAKGNDSTGSKQTATFDELVRVVTEVRLPHQYVMAVIDGIGWKRRGSDLRKLYNLWATRQIEGMYTLASLDQFREDLKDAAIRARLLPHASRDA